MAVDGAVVVADAGTEHEASGAAGGVSRARYPRESGDLVTPAAVGYAVGELTAELLPRQCTGLFGVLEQGRVLGLERVDLSLGVVIDDLTPPGAGNDLVLHAHRRGRLSDLALQEGLEAKELIEQGSGEEAAQVDAVVW